MYRRLTAPFLFSLVLMLSGCGDSVELHRNISEQEANEVIAELADKQIRAQKVPGKDGVAVRVKASDISRAVRTLDAAGLPKTARSTLGDIFRKEGVISTPLEERARYIYALSQELESTLSNIDGVIVARVHVVLPERVAPGEPVQPASASVFIKHDPRLDPDNINPRVRRLVASSIPGMASAIDNTTKLTVIFCTGHRLHRAATADLPRPFSGARARPWFLARQPDCAADHRSVSRHCLAVLAPQKSLHTRPANRAGTRP